MQSARTIQELAEIQEGIPLWGIMPDSPSARAGLQYGDIILQIGDRRVKTVTDYAEAMKSRTGSTVTVRFFRGGQQLETELLMDPQSTSLSFEETAQHIVDNEMMPRFETPSLDDPPS